MGGWASACSQPVGVLLSFLQFFTLHLGALVVAVKCQFTQLWWDRKGMVLSQEDQRPRPRSATG